MKSFLNAAAVLLVAALLAAACSTQSSTEAPESTATVEPTPTSAGATEPTVEAAPTADVAAEPTVSAPGTPAIASTDAPDPERVAQVGAGVAEPGDTSEILVQADDWTITRDELDTMVSFVEEMHELLFREAVGIYVSTDIGAEFARGFEPLSQQDWYVLRGLGLADTQADRDIANQLRLDRIRGFCCTARDADGFNGPESVAVGIEVQATKLATEAIIVHELVHALHTQNPQVVSFRPPPTDESPLPFVAGFEGVPQYLAFAYIELGPEADQRALELDLPIVPADQIALIGQGPSQHLNFGYDVGEGFVDAVVADRGVQGLFDLLNELPVTTEQVFFPEKYLLGEEATIVQNPDLPSGADVVAAGTLGVGMLFYALREAHGDAAARALVSGWAGDRYGAYMAGDRLCLGVSIEMDSALDANDLAAALLESLLPADPQALAAVTDNTINLNICGG